VLEIRLFSCLLLLVAELLRRGSTGGMVGVENTGQRLKEVQGVMDGLQTGVNVALKTVTAGCEDKRQGYRDTSMSDRKKRPSNTFLGIKPVSAQGKPNIIGTFSSLVPTTSLNMNPKRK
jgi:hypothetical protein